MYPPTEFRWINPVSRKTISGVDVETGKPSVEFKWNALRPQYVHTLLGYYNNTDPTIYMILPVEHQLLTTASNITNGIDWAIFKGKMSRPSHSKVRMGGITGWREDLLIVVTQVEYVTTYTES